MLEQLPTLVSRWLPALGMMVVIFSFSSIPAADMPRFDWADFLVKKGGHMTGYALLALAVWRGLGWDVRRAWLVWALTVLYAITDEFHQAFVPGRGASWVDVAVFDALGAALGLVIRARIHAVCETLRAAVRRKG